ncbi:hypothetical protein AZE42_12260 [Rhizopogon vesiculosus]|uniref:Uncharacterized protein n=1 Tax=Rhizopogon vesiculosus TaxID=180088 RepID=A0A1J8Q8B8_9AGAM|nr:hypothetical protein AZE42_12260 [Rhizopogon vesiculosus]
MLDNLQAALGEGHLAIANCLLNVSKCGARSACSSKATMNSVLSPPKLFLPSRPLRPGHVDAMMRLS